MRRFAFIQRITKLLFDGPGGENESVLRIMRESAIVKKRIIAAVISMLSLVFLNVATAAEEAIETQIVDAMNKIFGVHPGFRANHAKGIVVEGNFKPTPEAAALSKAALFSGNTIPFTARFSDASGVPNIPDGVPNANPHGIAIKFHLPDGSDADIVINALKFFPVSNAVDFRDLFLAIIASPKDAPKPTKLEQFVAAHPSVAASRATVKTPDSFAHEDYFGVNAFVFMNKGGVKQAFRYHLAPEQSAHMEAEEAAKMAPDFLIEELLTRLKKGPVTFHLKAQLAAPGDPTNDATKAWPDDRKEVDLGLLTIEKAAANSLEAQKPLLFLPGQLPDGIEPSDDPLIDLRNAAYAVSFSRRNP
jgi:catalase